MFSSLSSPRAPTATGEPWCERPHLFTRGGHPAASAPGSFTPRLANQSPRPWRSDGRHSAPPDRRHDADNCLCGLAVSERHARAAGTLAADEGVRWPEWLRTTYAAPRLSPAGRPFSRPSGAPTRGVSCKYWWGSSANSTRRREGLALGEAGVSARCVVPSNGGHFPLVPLAFSPPWAIIGRGQRPHPRCVTGEG